jgi:hypothetical protein
MSNFAFLQPDWPDVQDRVSKAEALALPVARTEAAELDALFACLQHRAFRGEL